MKVKKLGLILGAAALKVVTDTLMVTVTTIALALTALALAFTFPDTVVADVVKELIYDVGDVAELFGYTTRFRRNPYRYGGCYIKEPETINEDVPEIINGWQ